MGRCKNRIEPNEACEVVLDYNYTNTNHWKIHNGDASLKN